MAEVARVGRGGGRPAAVGRTHRLVGSLRAAAHAADDTPWGYRVDQRRRRDRRPPGTTHRRWIPAITDPRSLTAHRAPSAARPSRPADPAPRPARRPGLRPSWPAPPAAAPRSACSTSRRRAGELDPVLRRPRLDRHLRRRRRLDDAPADPAAITERATPTAGPTATATGDWDGDARRPAGPDR